LLSIHFIQHESFEAPGAYLNWAEARGHKVRFSKVYEGAPLPQSVSGIDLLIVMGGPQSPQTTREECPHFDGPAEMDLIRKAIDAGKAIVGVCLGAQLMAEALGASVEHSPEKEIGVFPISLNDAGRNDKLIHHFGSLAVGHWHSDMPGLTREGRILASSEGCPRQIISYAPFVYGFQCHMEFTPELIELLIASDETPQESSTRNRFVQSPDEIRRFDFSEMNVKLFGFLDKLAAGYAEKKKK